MRALNVSPNRASPACDLHLKVGRRIGSSAFLQLALRKGSTQMASFHYRIKSGKKGNAVDHAAYIARVDKYSDRDEDLVESGVGNMPTWAADDSRSFWKMADKHERENGAVYREHEIALPAELSLEGQHELVIMLTRELAGERPYQFAIHAPPSSLDGAPNPHLHLMVSDRLPDGIDRLPENMFRRYNPARPQCGGCRKATGGRTRLQMRDDLIQTRRRCAELQNEVLAKYRHADRVDHRSLMDRGLRRDAERHLGQSRVKRMSAIERAEYIAMRSCESRVRPNSPGKQEQSGSCNYV